MSFLTLKILLFIQRSCSCREIIFQYVFQYFPKFVAFLCLKETFHLNFDLLNQDILIYTGHRVLEGYKLVYLIPI